VPGTSRSRAWLSLTPEPEGLLPAAVAALRAGRPPEPEAVERERERAERLVVRGRQRAWLAYLHEVVELIERGEASSDPAVADARTIALEVVHNHHQLLLGIPGPGAERTEEERRRLESATASPEPRLVEDGRPSPGAAANPQSTNGGPR
jgi:hypothetical protein